MSDTIILYDTMIQQKLILLGLVSTLILGCAKEGLETKIESSTSIINAQEYQFEGNKVRQLSSDEDNLAVYGVIADIHGEVEKAKKVAQKFKEQKVEGILCLGDMPKNEALRYGGNDSKNDYTEIREVLEALGQTGLPVLVIPGNHERKPDYERAMAAVAIRYPNIIDMSHYRIFDGDDVDFVSLPGYQIFKIPGRQFIPDDGYFASPQLIRETGKLREGLDDAVVLLAHGAGKTGKIGPATISSGVDVGDAATSEMMQENHISFALVGHIHEAGGLAATYQGIIVKPGQWARQFTANFGTLEEWKNLDGNTYKGMAGILTVQGEQAKFEMVYLK